MGWNVFALGLPIYWEFVDTGEMKMRTADANQFLVQMVSRLLLSVPFCIVLATNCYAQNPQLAVASKIAPSEQDIPAQTAVCKNSSDQIDKVFVDEHSKLMLQVITKSIAFKNAPYALFEIGVDGKPTGGWRICINTVQMEGVPLSKPDAPYVDAKIDALRGLVAECPRDPPGPAQCKDALAAELAARAASAIGTPRLSDGITAGAPSIKFWVPFQVVP